MPDPVEPVVPSVEPKKPVIADPLDAILELREENKRLRLDMKKAEEERSARERATLEEQGKHKEAYEKLLKEHEPLTQTLKAYEAELTTYREAEKARREALIQKLPEDKRKLYADVPTAVLEDMVTTLEVKPPPTKPDKPGSGDNDKAWEQYTFDELATMQSGDPQKWNRLRDDYMKRKGLKLR